MKPVLFLDFDDVLAIHQVHNSYRVLDAFASGSSMLLLVGGRRQPSSYGLACSMPAHGKIC